jgi:hypothetical protein
MLAMIAGLIILEKHFRHHTGRHHRLFLVFVCGGNLFCSRHGRHGAAGTDLSMSYLLGEYAKTPAGLA